MHERSTRMAIPLSIIGTIATEPRYAHTPGRAAYCSFRIAAHDRRFDRETGQWVDGEVNWFTIVSFRGLAEHASASFSKGDRVLVSGRLRVRRWETEEKSGTAVEIEADGLGHDLRFGTSTFARVPPRLTTAAEASSRTADDADSSEREAAGVAAALGSPAAAGFAEAVGGVEPAQSVDGFLPSAA